MKSFLLSIILVFVITLSGNAQFFLKQDPLTHTYSVLGRDPETGEIGGAVQSHYFCVGPTVLWGEAGTGMIATQSFVNVSFGMRGLDMLRKGMTPQQVVDNLIGPDSGKDYRQLAVMDTKGNTASYTGKYCIEGAGNLNGQDYSVEANLMLNNNIWPAMEKAFKETKGPLAEKLIAVLEAAQNAGGDIRGSQSAAIVVYKGKASDKPWEDKLVDLRVDDNPQPVAELKRLLKLWRAYEHANNGDLAVEKNNIDLALKEYAAAENMLPDYEEMKFWHAITVFNKDRKEEAYNLFREVFSKNENYRTLIQRCVNSKLLNATPKEVELITNLK